MIQWWPVTDALVEVVVIATIAIPSDGQNQESPHIMFQ